MLSIDVNPSFTAQQARDFIEMGRELRFTNGIKDSIEQVNEGLRAAIFAKKTVAVVRGGALPDSYSDRCPMVMQAVRDNLTRRGYNPPHGQTDFFEPAGDAFCTSPKGYSITVDFNPPK